MEAEAFLAGQFGLSVRGMRRALRWRGGAGLCNAPAVQKPPAGSHPPEPIRAPGPLDPPTLPESEPTHEGLHSPANSIFSCRRVPSLIWPTHPVPPEHVHPAGHGLTTFSGDIIYTPSVGPPTNINVYSIQPGMFLSSWLVFL